MKKAMISQPMNGLSEEQIRSAREKAIHDLHARGYEVMNTYFEDDWPSKAAPEDVKHNAVHFLARSINAMSHCDAVYFCDGWQLARGCKIEHDVANSYNLEMLYPTKTLEG
jgi:hypothetical protein